MKNCVIYEKYFMTTNSHNGCGKLIKNLKSIDASKKE
jgi:hypothetical protein